MNDEEKFKEKIYEVFSDIISNILKRKEPFGNLPFNSEDYEHDYRNYLKYYNDLDESFRTDILDAVIEESKYRIQDVLLGTKEDFSSKYLKHSNNLIKFYGWIKNKEKEADQQTSGSYFIREVNVNNIRKDILDNFKEQLPEFKYVKGKYVKGALNFVKPYSGKNLIVLVDIGSKKAWINFLMGMDSPYFIIDIKKLFLTKNSAFVFNSNADAVNKISLIVKLVKEVLSQFERELTKRADP